MTTGSSPWMSGTPISNSAPSVAGPMSIVRSSFKTTRRIAVRTACLMSASITPCFRAGSPIRYLDKIICLNSDVKENWSASNIAYAVFTKLTGQVWARSFG